ncbi:MAG: type IX secretion system membrane protein PorP/SprF [Bacteroidia bacterium]|nr:type IX secretion system membrane protein PorP/SprF [Bacteroidia bacterium]
MMKKNYIFILLVVVLNLRSQYDHLFTQFMFNEVFINPGYAGSKEALSITALHRQQWMNFPGRPVTTTFSMHGPLFVNKMGLGINFLNERIGKLQRNLAYLTYAYRIKTDKKGTLGLGINIGVHNQVNKLSELKANDAGDIQISNNTPSLNSPNTGFGLFYSTDKFYAGLSVPRLIDDSYFFDEQSNIKQKISFNFEKLHYYFVIGRIFKINPDLYVKPQGMVKMVQNAPLQYDANVSMLIKKIIWFGLSYRSNAAAVGILGIQATPQLYFGYSYDYGLNEIQRYSQGSHEVVLNYLFSYKQKKVTSPRFF